MTTSDTNPLLRSRPQRDPRLLGAAIILLLLLFGITTLFGAPARQAKAQPVPTAPPPARIGNYVWIDENEDGYQDAGEPGIPNVRVVAYSNGVPVGSALTDANGGYSILVPAGTFTVSVDASTLPVGLTQTTNPVLPGADFGNQSQPYQVTVASGDENLTADFGYNWGTPDNPPPGALGAIGDRVWVDADGDGAQDPGEPGIGNVEVVIYYDSNNDGKVEPGIDALFTGAVDQNGNTGTGTTTTHPDGTYIFDQLPAGPYVVIVNTPPAGYTQTGDPDDFGKPATNPDNRTTTPVVLEPGDVFLNADFGYQPTQNDGPLDGSIGDTVFYDLDANGTYNPGLSDSGIPGVTVLLARDDGNGVIDEGEIIATDITDANGNYLFDGLPPGNYLVAVNDTQSVINIGVDYFRTFGTSPGANNNSQTSPYAIALGAGEDNLTADFGFTPPNQDENLGLIGDTVWLDNNANGVQEPDEPGIEGIEVTLTLPDSSTRTTTTNENGIYHFGGLPAGTYTVTVTTPPPGLTQTFDADGLATPHQSTLTLAQGEINLDQDFGYRGLGSIGDLVWNDIDADGVRDAGEPPLAGITLDLYWDLNGNGVVDPAEPLIGKQTTNAAGAYLFTGLPTNDGGGDARFVVDVTDEANLLAGYWHSSGAAGVNNNSQVDPYAVTLTPGQPQNLTADFGYYVIPAAVGDFVWRDDDSDGIQDPGEPGIPGVDVTLTITYPNGDVIRLVDTTDAFGKYLFGNLLLDEDYNGQGTSGNEGEPVFVITFETPDGFIPTVPNVGANDSVDSDGLSTVANPIVGTTNLTYDSGFEVRSRIGNYVWIDENEDGYQDAGEPGIPNVRVVAYSNGVPVGSALTDANGGYSILVPAGTFTVSVDASTLPVGLTQTTNPVLPGADFGNQSQPYQVTVASGDENLTADFGYNWGTPDNPPPGALGAIGDRVWVDADGDGAQDPGEPGIGNVEVVIYYDSNNDGKVEPGIDALFTGAVDQNGNTGTGTTTTHPDGTYIFDQLPAGPYVVIVNTPPAGYTQTGDPDDFGKPATNPDNRTTTPVVLEPGDVFLNADFGYQPTQNDGPLDGSIGDTVFYDLDANGTYNPGLSDSGIPGVTVLLARDDGNGVIDEGEIIATDITDANGNYLFDGLPPGNYLVAVNDTQSVINIGVDYFRTFGTSPGANNNSQTSPYAIALGAGEDNLTADFGFTPAGQTPNQGLIGDTVWLDINGNGVQEPDEPGIEGIEVTLTLPDSSTRTTTTNENGIYHFGGLPAGTYTVTVTTPPPGLTQTFDADGLATPHQSTLTLAQGEINLDQDFGYRGLGSIGDLVWNDIDADGVRDAGEPPLAGITLDLYWDLNGNGVVDPGEPLLGKQTTNAAGAYLFTGLPTNDGGGDARFVVDVTDEANLLAGYWHSSGAAGVNNNSQVDPYAVTLTPGQPQNLTADFGYYVIPAVLGDFVWRDNNVNGIQDPGEPGIPGVDVTLTITYPNGDVIRLVDTTDGNGIYRFGNLLLDEDYNGQGTSGNEGEPVFVITFEIPDGFTPTLPNVGADDSVDSDGLSTVANPIVGTINLTYDSGFEVPAIVGDFVWNDANANGIQDPGEVGVPGVTVSLLDELGNAVLDINGNAITATTTITGFYLFEVLPGSYRINFSNFPTGQQLTNPLQGNDPALDSDPNATTGTTGVFTLAPGEINLTIDAGLATPTALDDLPDQPKDPEDFGIFLPIVAGD